MQPYFFPYLGYFQLISAVDKFIIYDDVNYINRGWINRNNILINGKANLINVPLSNASQNKLIKDTFVVDDIKWKKKLIKTVEQSYLKAPYFENTILILKQTLNEGVNNISSLNHLSIKLICNYLEIETEIINSSTRYNNCEIRGQDRIINICKKENATHYINPIGGLSMYENNKFISHNLILSFLQPHLVPYKQYKNEFVPGLSIIDSLMFCSKSEIRDTLLQQYELL